MSLIVGRFPILETSPARSELIKTLGNRFSNVTGLGWQNYAVTAKPNGGSSIDRIFNFTSGSIKETIEFSKPTDAYASKFTRMYSGIGPEDAKVVMWFDSLTGKVKKFKAFDKKGKVLDSAKFGVPIKSVAERLSKLKKHLRMKKLKTAGEVAKKAATKVATKSTSVKSAVGVFLGLCLKAVH